MNVRETALEDSTALKLFLRSVSEWTLGRPQCIFHAVYRLTWNVVSDIELLLIHTSSGRLILVGWCSRLPCIKTPRDEARWSTSRVLTLREGTNQCIPDDLLRPNSRIRRSRGRPTGGFFQRTPLLWWSTSLWCCDVSVCHFKSVV